VYHCERSVFRAKNYYIVPFARLSTAILPELLLRLILPLSKIVPQKPFAHIGGCAISLSA
jgi:hypothetical protein